MKSTQNTLIWYVWVYTRVCRYSLIYIFAADSPFLLSKETFTSTIIWNLVLKGIRTLQCEIICQWIFFAFFKTSTFTCVLQHIIFSWPLSDLEREIFWYELHPFSGIMIFFSWQFQFSEIINEFEGIYFQILFKSF